MKKFTALALAVVMTLLAVSSAIPVFAVDVAKAEDLQEAMKKGEDVTLTGDVNLSAIEWETISEYAGTLDGKGYTITVPSDTTFIDKLSGTVKNVNLTGRMDLGFEDVSKVKVINDVKGGGLGVVANYAWGATIENVNSDVDVVLVQTEDGIVNYGGIVGNAWSTWKDDNTVLDRAVTIRNCSVGGSAYLGLFKGQKNAIGGIIGMCAANAVVEGCAVRTTMLVENSQGQNGGIIGSSYGDTYKNSDNTNYVESSKLVPTQVTNCLFDGDVTFIGMYAIDQSACIVGYARGVNIKNCFATGSWNAVIGGGAKHIFGYCNASAEDYFKVTVEGCASTASVYSNSSAQQIFAFGNGFCFNANNNMLMSKMEINGNNGTTSNKLHMDKNNDGVLDEADGTLIEYAVGDDDKLLNSVLTQNGKDSTWTDIPKRRTGNEIVGNAAAVVNEFVSRNSAVFSYENSVMKLNRETKIYDGHDLAIVLAEEEPIFIENDADFERIIPYNTYILENDITITKNSHRTLNLYGNYVWGEGYTVTWNGATNRPLFQYAKDSAVYDMKLAGTLQENGKQSTVVQGGLIGRSVNNELFGIENNINVKITYKYKAKTTYGGSIGGVIGLASGYLMMGDCYNNGNITVDTIEVPEKSENFKFNPNVGGFIGQFNLSNTQPYSCIERCINNGTISYGATKPGNGNVGGIVGSGQATSSVNHADDVQMVQCANRGEITGKIAGERVGGLCGYWGDIALDLCYNTGKMTIASVEWKKQTSDTAPKEYYIENPKTNAHERNYGLVGYINTTSLSGNTDTNQDGSVNVKDTLTMSKTTRSGSVTNSYVFNNGQNLAACYAQTQMSTGGVTGVILKGNYILDGLVDTTCNLTNQYVTFEEYVASTKYTDASDLLAKLEANQATAGVFVADDCNINYGYPIFAWEAHDYVTLYEENEKNYVTTGKDLDCDKYNNAEFAGFVQFANDSNKVRFVMAIDADYLAEASTKYESFDVVITVNGDMTATVNSLTLSSYTEVTAGTDVYYADECEIFGFIMNFGDTVVSSLDFKIVIGNETFELGSYTAN